MRPVLYVLSFLAVLGLAFWAYRENYATQHQLKLMSGLQDEIATLRDEISLQRAEWAYLNRPDRLRELATLNFDRLGLLPMEPEQLASSARVSYPAAPMLKITGTIETEGLLNPPAVTPPAGRKTQTGTQQELTP
jgi:hypothetical protein